MRIAILPDSGPTVGMGHLGRCLALGQAIHRLKRIKPFFLTKDSIGQRWIRERGFPARSAAEGPWDLLIVDSYRLQAKELRQLRRCARTFVLINDGARIEVACDWVVNSAVHAKKASDGTPTAANVLLGPDFQPLRKEYWSGRTSYKGTAAVKNVFVSLGGGVDGEKLLKRVIPMVRQVLPEALVHAIVSPFMRLSSNDERVKIYLSPKDVRSVLRRCEMAVTGGGQTLFELAFAGVPAVAVVMADNQKPNVQGFASAGALLSAGQPSEAGFDRRLRRLISRLARDSGLRDRIAKRGQSLVDGKGAMRVAHFILNGRSNGGRTNAAA